MIKPILKKIIFIICVILVSPLILLSNFWSGIASDAVFCALACLVSMVPGLIGSNIRVAYYKGTIKGISAECYIGFGSFITKRNAEIGKNANIGAYCIIGSAKIGENVLIASRVSLLSGKHQHGSTSKVEIGQNSANRYNSIKIGKSTWIGEGSIIAANLGENCIVAFGTPVGRDIPDNYLVAGNPPKLIKRLTVETA